MTINKYGLSVRLSERTKNISKSDMLNIQEQRTKIYDHCQKNNIILNSPDKIKETSVINQIWMGINYCKDNNLTLHKIYIDLYISGGKWERDELNEMLKDFDSGIIQGWVIKDLDRYARDVFFQEKIINEYRKIKGADFRLIIGQELLDRELERKMIGVMNEMPIIKGKENSKVLFSNKERDNLPCIPAPFGYRYDAKTKDWIIDKRKAKVVMFIYMNMNMPYMDVCKKFKISKSTYYKIKDYINEGVYTDSMILYYKKIKDLKGKVIRKEKVKYKGNFEKII
jgi:DNA invertase Pin-like site-specific DNA recombinase